MADVQVLLAAAPTNGAAETPTNEAAEAPTNEPVDTPMEEKKELSFGELWAKLKEDGWTYKKGTGLVAWLYCKPGVEALKTAKKNVDYFETEETVLASVYGRPITTEEPQKRKRAATSRLVLGCDDDDGDEGEPKKRSRKDGPKRPPTAYALYQKQLREGEKELGNKTTSTEMQQKWKDLGEKEQQPYKEQAEALKEAYNIELAKFKADHPELFADELRKEQEKEQKKKLKEEQKAAREALKQQKEALRKAQEEEKKRNTNLIGKFTVKGAALPLAPFALSKLSSPSFSSKGLLSPPHVDPEPSHKVIVQVKLPDPLPPLQSADEQALEHLMSRLQGGKLERLQHLRHFCRALNIKTPNAPLQPSAGTGAGETESSLEPTPAAQAEMKALEHRFGLALRALQFDQRLFPKLRGPPVPTLDSPPAGAGTGAAGNDAATPVVVEEAEAKAELASATSIGTDALNAPQTPAPVNGIISATPVASDTAAGKGSAGAGMTLEEADDMLLYLARSRGPGVLV